MQESGFIAGGNASRQRIEAIARHRTVRLFEVGAISGVGIEGVAVEITARRSSGRYRLETRRRSRAAAARASSRAVLRTASDACGRADGRTARAARRCASCVTRRRCVSLRLPCAGVDRREQDERG